MWGQRLQSCNCLPPPAMDEDAGPSGQERPEEACSVGPSACDSRRDMPRGSKRDYGHTNIHPAHSVILPSLQFRIAELGLQEVSETFR